MSYILDALKKTQPHNDMTSANVDPTPSSPGGISVVWVWVLGAALALNVIVLGWFVLTDKPADESAVVSSSDHRQALPPAQSNSSTQPRTRPAVTAVEPALENELSDPQLARATEPATTPPPATQRATPPPTTQQSAPPPRQTQRSQPPVQMQLDELSATDQDRFLGLSFTSHIYTDDPNLCAVVIDGQRLRNGDTVQGLKIEEITPGGVIFRERRNGQRDRLVAVNPFE